MTVTLKTAEDIAGMRVAGKLAADVLEMIAEHVKPGVTTEALDRICHDYIVDVQKPSLRRSTTRASPSPSAPRSTTWSAMGFQATSR